jgi:hypothetical protein
MAERSLSRPVTRASFWFLDDGTSWTTEITDEDRRKTLDSLVATVRQMEQASEFPPAIGQHCALCPYLYACEVRDQVAERRAREGW